VSKSFWHFGSLSREKARRPLDEDGSSKLTENRTNSEECAARISPLPSLSVRRHKEEKMQPVQANLSFNHEARPSKSLERKYIRLNERSVACVSALQAMYRECTLQKNAPIDQVAHVAAKVLREFPKGATSPIVAFINACDKYYILWEKDLPPERTGITQIQETLFEAEKNHIKTGKSSDGIQVAFLREKLKNCYKNEYGLPGYLYVELCTIAEEIECLDRYFPKGVKETAEYLKEWEETAARLSQLLQQQGTTPSALSSFLERQIASYSMTQREKARQINALAAQTITEGTLRNKPNRENQIHKFPSFSRFPPNCEAQAELYALKKKAAEAAKVKTLQEAFTQLGGQAGPHPPSTDCATENLNVEIEEWVNRTDENPTPLPPSSPDPTTLSKDSMTEKLKQYLCLHAPHLQGHILPWLSHHPLHAENIQIDCEKNQITIKLEEQKKTHLIPCSELKNCFPRHSTKVTLLQGAQVQCPKTIKCTIRDDRMEFPEECPKLVCQVRFFNVSVTFDLVALSLPNPDENSAGGAEVLVEMRKSNLPETLSTSFSLHEIDLFLAKLLS